MPAPSPELVVDDPPPLNPRLAVWPYAVEPMPLARLFKGLGALKVAGEPRAKGTEPVESPVRGI